MKVTNEIIKNKYLINPREVKKRGKGKQRTDRINIKIGIFFIGNHQTFPKVVVPFYDPISNGIINLLKFSYSSGCIMIFHCDFTFVFS